MITDDLLRTIDAHWAIQAVGDESLRERILQQAKAILVKNEIGNQLKLNLEETNILDDDIHRLATAYEMLAIEGMNDFINHTSNDVLQDQFLAGANRAFELRKTLQFPKDDLQFMLYLLHLSSLAYCGDCWTDLKYIYKKHQTEITELLKQKPSAWNERVLFQLFNCWVNLFAKESLEDLEGIANNIIKLRDEQEELEKQYLSNNSKTDELRYV